MIEIVAVVATLAGSGLGFGLARYRQRLRMRAMWQALAHHAASKAGDITVYEMADIVEAFTGKGR
jgi:membrane protein YqaA with SNARE-associated domain